MGPKIVLIEDHAMVRQLFANLLRHQLGAAQLSESTTASEGAKLLLREQPDLAIIDWMLPDGRGVELVRELAPSLPQTRWLMISASEEGHLVREAIELGVHGFVMKRSDLATMQQAVTDILGGKSFYCPVSSRLLVDRLVVENQARQAPLTTREREILRGFARGENSKATAERLGISVKTAQNHFTALKDKLGLQEPADLLRYAIKHGYVETF